MQQTNSLHFKVQLGNELRRFAIQTPSFEYLKSTIRDLFGVTGRLIIKYLDDENDMISISSDIEFQHAIELTEMPLRLTVEVAEDVQTPVETTPVETTEEPSRPFGRGQRGRCGRGNGRGRFADMTVEERLNVKSDKLAKRIQNLEKKMENNTIPNGRARTLGWRLEKMKHKLEMINKQKQALKDGVPVGGPVGRGGRGCGGRGRGGCGRGRWRNNQVNTNFDSASTDTSTDTSNTSTDTFSTEESESSGSSTVMTPKNLNQKVRQCRQRLNAAKKSGNEIEIESCETALKEALEEKRSKQEARKNFNDSIKQQRARIQQCKVNLRNARQTGQNKEVIDSCLAALQSAKMELQEARTSFSSTQ